MNDIIIPYSKRNALSQPAYLIYTRLATVFSFGRVA